MLLKEYILHYSICHFITICRSRSRTLLPGYCMTILNKDWPVEFPLLTVIRTIVCCDLDETYIPSDTEKKALGGVELLESYITSHAEEKGILAGWITGTNLDSAWRKSRGYISRSPHFICCSIGTEFYWVKNGRLRPSETWAERIRRSGYSLQPSERQQPGQDPDGKRDAPAETTGGLSGPL